MPAPDDLPAPHQQFGLEAFFNRWPTGAEKVELVRGDLLFAGRFDDRDIDTASQAHPGRRVEVDDDDDGLWVTSIPGTHQ